MPEENRTNVLFAHDIVTAANACADALKFVTSPECGAVSMFTGITRNDFVKDKGTVVGLEFEAHAPLAIAVMTEIVEQYRLINTEVRHVYIVHRLGYVPVGDFNVVVAVSSPHRAVALKAVDDLMNELKAHFPVWKKEVYDQGEYTWKENSEVEHVRISQVS